MLDLLAREAVRELNEIQKPPMKERAKAWGKGLLGRGNALGRDPVFWPAGLLLVGLMEAGQTDAAAAYVDEWIRKGCVVQNPDDALAGTVLLELYERTGKERCREAAGKVAAYLAGCIRDGGGSIVYGQRSGNRYIFADGAGQTAMFLARYAGVIGAAGSEAGAADEAEAGAAGSDAGSAKGAGADAEAGRTPAAGQRAPYSPAEALADARRQLVNYARYGMDARSGLPYHGYDWESGIRYGIIGWGRAVGWLLFGLSEYLCDAALFAGTGAPAAEETAAQGTGAAAQAAAAEETAVQGSKEQKLAAVQAAAAQETAAQDTAAAQEHRQIEELAQEICSAVYERIRPDGLLSWQLDCLEGPLDSSAAGMIFYSLLRMNQFRDAHPELPAQTLAGIPRTDPAVLDAAAAGLRSCITEDGKVWYASGECIDFSQYSQQYGNYAWGQGSVLAFLSLSDLK